jgi:outer membrane protein
MFLPTLSYRNQKSQFFPDPRESAREEQRRQLAYGLSGLPQSYYPLFSSGSGSGGINLPPNIRSGQRLVLHVPIFTGLSEYTNFQVRKKEIVLRKLEMNEETRLLMVDLSHNYFSIQLIKRSLDSKRESFKLTENLYNEYKRRAQLGMARNYEMENFKARMAGLEAEIFSLEQQYEAGLERLSFLCGISVGSIFKEISNYPIPNYSLEEGLEMISNRSDVKIAKINKEVTEKKSLGAKGEFLPVLSIDGIYNIPQGNTGESYFAQFIMDIPLFSGGRTLTAMREAESLEKEASLNLQSVIRNAHEEVRVNYKLYKSSEKEVQAYKKAYESAMDSHKLLMVDFKKKIGNSIDLLNSAIYLESIRDLYERSLIQLQLNRTLLGIVVGEFPKLAVKDKESQK